MFYPVLASFFHKNEEQMNSLSVSTLALLNGTTYSSGSGSLRGYKQGYSENILFPETGNYFVFSLSL
jgi:hypothetical protein